MSFDASLKAQLNCLREEHAAYMCFLEDCLADGSMTATAADIVKKTAEQDYESAQVLHLSLLLLARLVLMSSLGRLSRTQNADILRRAVSCRGPSQYRLHPQDMFSSDRQRW